MDICQVAFTEQQTVSTATGRVVKRAASDELEGQVKKIMVDGQSCEKQGSSIIPKSSNQPKFVSAAEIAANARTNVQIMPEIPDDELLEMAIQFEKKYPQ
ncbi:unnamed protein product [Rotaria sordida]|uniref:Uncharacterized protein n=1 Tax=Rotaria sordida TaxID=392033 RepID=A0A814E3I4_9BILA|nr:unnamed protein product [Rotaria sordida]CAF1049946.1 unnamed protein product [Rotaria sordida]